MAIHSVTYNADGSTDAFDVPFPYLQAAHVVVSVAGAETDFNWLNTTRIQLPSAPLAGTVVRISRKTPTAPLYTIPSNRPVPSEWYNLLTRQAIYVAEENRPEELGGVEEALETSAAAQSLASEALTASTTARTQAAEAHSTATTARTQATEAKADASTAKTQASSASSTASTAQTQAAAAQTAASTAQTRATAAETVSNQTAQALARTRQSLVVNVGDFLDGIRTDRQAIDAAIASLPATGRACLRLPYKGTPWTIAGTYIQYGARRITWELDDAVTFDPANHIAKLNAPTYQSRMYRTPAFANRRDTTALTLITGSGLLDDAASISGYDTLAEQAAQPERGMAGMYLSTGSGGSIKIPSATFTAITFTPATPIDTNPLRVGMFVDVPGENHWTGSNAATVRFTSRIVSWAEDGTSITVEGWWRHNGAQNAVQATPPNGRRVIINPRTKMWGGNINIYCNEADGANYGEVSGSFLECAFVNNTGKAATNYYNNNTQPFHFYGFDASIKGGLSEHGGGIPFLARGQDQRWWHGFENQAADIGFLNTDTAQNLLSSTAFCASQSATGGAGTAFLSRSNDGSGFDRNVAISGTGPTIQLGRTTAESTPQIQMKSSAGASAWDALISVTGGAATNGRGTLTVTARQVDLNSDLLNIIATDIRLTGLPKTRPATPNRLWLDGETLKVSI